MAELAAAAGPAPARPWDPLVRITHWGVALAVLLNGLVTEGGSALHVWIGYAALAALATRLLWGFVGPEEARFSAFPPSLSAARAHLRERMAGRHAPHRSHNPLGALMVYALWGTLLVTAGTGIAMDDAPTLIERPYAVEAEHEDGEEAEGEELLEEAHETAANLLLILAALHVAGVAVETRAQGPGLLRRMLPGGGGRRG